MGYLYISASVFCMVYSQLILKWRITKLGTIPVIFTDKIFFLVKALVDPFILSGFIAAFVASLFWMLTLSKIDLSSAYPIAIGGLAVLTSLCAVAFFNESLSLIKIAGLAIVMVGMFVISRG